jgi:hypothetical protein
LQEWDLFHTVETLFYKGNSSVTKIIVGLPLSWIQKDIISILERDKDLLWQMSESRCRRESSRQLRQLQQLLLSADAAWKQFCCGDSVRNTKEEMTRTWRVYDEIRL